MRCSFKPFEGTVEKKTKGTISLIHTCTLTFSVEAQTAPAMKLLSLFIFTLQKFQSVASQKLLRFEIHLNSHNLRKEASLENDHRQSLFFLGEESSQLGSWLDLESIVSRCSAVGNNCLLKSLCQTRRQIIKKCRTKYTGRINTL